MCGILGMIANNPVVQDLYDGLVVLQHRGQDAAGLATYDGNQIHMKKGNGLVRDVFRTKNMIRLKGNIGIGHVRYPTAGCYREEEAQPFYVNAPFGIVLGHNGNLTNYAKVKAEVIDKDMRHLNTSSDSELLLNVLAHQLIQQKPKGHLTVEQIFDAVKHVYKRIEGGYAVMAMIAGHGLLAFRDPNGIRPLVMGMRKEAGKKPEYILASESVAVQTMGFEILRDVGPGEAVFIDIKNHKLHSKSLAKAEFTPCIFEFVYLARPDSMIDGISVYKARIRMGQKLAKQIKEDKDSPPIDVVIPVPETSRPIALAMSEVLKVRFREGFVKNRYIGRTFIMPSQHLRQKSIRYKLNPIPLEFKGKNVLLVDDSIVRGNTSRKIVEMVREAGAKKVYFASAAPPIVNPDVYGIDMPTRAELIANRLTIPQIAKSIGVDKLYYQKIEDLLDSAREGNKKIRNFCWSCMGGPYPAGNITEEVLQRVEKERFAYQTSGGSTDEDQMPLL
ncbi:amidophosphoribosyltransferase [Patescibacteria group bacterium]|nr:amidophosphoribosyltransferase [Patescibacteria group bacterium]MBU1016530.1 amidophosphoribosyltransferase [Patescibacteria group bacterium]MBU1684916.1 amidophosphoribosyltransferase [Patescibacteria group bacterium]MBU1938334.1 amidophosphoribosyltransferase [Patescibacteria group bacterium]